MKPLGSMRWTRFSLRTLFVLLTVTAGWLAWQTNRAVRQRELVRSLQSDGYTVSYDTRGPEWIAGLVGIDFFGKVTGVDGYHNKNIGADRLSALSRLGSLQRLQIAVSHTDEDTFRAIGEMSTLQMLVLSTPPFPTEHFAYLSRLEQLEKVYITQPIGDDGIRYLCRLPLLKSINISSERTTQAGIQQLAALQHLEFVKLHGNLEVSGQTRRVLGSVVIDDGSWHRMSRQIVSPVQTAEQSHALEPAAGPDSDGESSPPAQ